MKRLTSILLPWRSILALNIFAMVSICMPLNAQPPTRAESASETALFNDLDLTLPQLSAVSSAWKSKDLPAAESAFASYLRNRTSVNWGGSSDNSKPNISPAVLTRAASAVHGKITASAGLAYEFPNGNIDWRFNAPQHTPGHARDDEWQWQLNRMGFWADMANAYKASADEQYARAFVSQLRSWIAQCPPPNHIDNTVGSPWRTIDAGIRAQTWPDAFFAFRRSRTVTDKDLVTFAAAFHDHGVYLHNFPTSSNWLTMEMNGLYSVASLFPELKEAADWRAFATRTLANYAKTLFLPDGAEVELSTGYQGDVLSNWLRIRQIAGWNNRLGDLPPDYLSPIEGAFSWDVSLSTPDFSLPKINDSWEVSLPALFKNAPSMYPSRADFRWIASKGKAGQPPAKSSLFLNWSGFAAMRSGWTPDTNYLLFRIGPMGAGHMHQDKLDVLLWAYGREMLFDSGGGPYEKSKWREWGISTFSHNCVIVDNLAQSPQQKNTDPNKDPDLVSQAPINGHWESNAQFDFSSGAYTGAYGPNRVKPATQQRDVLFLKPNIYIVADRMTPADSNSHRYEARWNLLTTHSQVDPDTHTLVTTDSGMANAAIVPLSSSGLSVTSVSAQEEPEILGWELHHDTSPSRTPATTLLHSRSGSGKQLILTMIIPLKPGEGNPVASVKASSDGNSATVSMKDGSHFVVVCPKDRGISIKEFLANNRSARSAQAGTN